jgi:hypothetical protein
MYLLQYIKAKKNVFKKDGFSYPDNLISAHASSGFSQACPCENRGMTEKDNNYSFARHPSNKAFSTKTVANILGSLA